ncbi:MAG: N-acetylglucosamine-6-phosphate deacetylase [Acidobacteriota bacterium]
MSSETKNSSSSPGYLDLHIHGAFGVDVLTASAAEMDRLAVGLAARGVAEFLPTLVPLPLPELADAVTRLSAWMRPRRAGDGRGAMPLGIHFEGPFVSAARCGALHRKDFLDGTDPRAMGAFFEIASSAPGRGMTTLAPEIPGGIAVVREFVKRHFLVSIGHTEADAATLDAAFSAGARHMTHFGNAMRPLHHRDVGPIGWGLTTDGVTVDVIADGHHLSREMLRLVFRVKGDARVALVSDAMPAAGLADGDYAVWGETLTVKDGAARNVAGALAGSTALLDECVARLASIGVSAETARGMASDVPRRILGAG